MNKGLINKTKEYYQKKYDNIYNPRAVKAALYYSRKYDLDYGNNSTYNNEADAFKHTFASALVSLEEGYFISLGGGLEHEWSNKNNNPAEYKMDVNNNGIGRQIAREIKWEYGSRWNKLNDREKDEIIAEKVFARMKKGHIILDPSGRTKLKNHRENWDKHGNTTYEKNIPVIHSTPRQSWDRYGNVTGYAADITDDEKQDIINKYKNSDSFKGMSDDEILNRYVDFEEQKFFNPKNRVFYENEFNPALAPRGSNERIFGRATGAKAS